VTTEADHRLPRHVIPRHYRLTLEPDLTEFTFSGREVVAVEVVEATAAVVLNAAELAVDAAAISAVGGSDLFATDIAFDEAAERLTITFPEMLAPGDYELTLSFRGTLNDELRGFYRSTYKDEAGNDAVIATTQFEATDARRAFPCWDEPDLKATFGVTLIVPAGYAAISNGPEVARSDVGPGNVAVTFADTMVMSTYLVAFIVGELQATDVVDAAGVPLRVVTPPGKTHLADFALEAGAHALGYFADYYGIPYPGDKVDMIAIPDFAWGAMENLGAITYRESALLVDPTTATRTELERVAGVIAHELAHMWFGDLVTMKWWNGIWLNEAFATFMEMKCTEAFRPDWKIFLGAAADRAAAMEIDALATTRPVEFPVASPEEANAMFDTLTYEKGSSVLRMLEQYIGEETFRRGIGSYLAAHAYGNTVTDDLWDALELASGEPVRDIMHGWIYQGGFPQVRVEPTGEQWSLRQEQFRYLGEGDGTWKVPVLYDGAAGPGRVIVDEPVAISPGDGALVNAGGSGFYRVRYAPELLEAVAGRLGELDPEERYSVVSDTWANVLSGEVPAPEFIELVGGLSEETEPAVWRIALTGLAELDRVASSDVQPALQAFVRELVAPQADRLGWSPETGEGDLTRELRGLLLRARGGLGDDQDTVTEARGVLEQALDAPDTVDGEVASAALAIVASNGGVDDFARFLELREDAATPQDQVRFLRAAAAVPEQDTATELLKMVLTGDIRSQDAFWLTALLLGHKDTGAASWQQVKEQWDEVLAVMPKQNLRRMFDLIQYRSEPEVAADIKAWLDAHPVAGFERHLAQQMERLDVRVGLRERESDRIEEAF
jgi:puromycin-sensitive aminopeptidase